MIRQYETLVSFIFIISTVLLAIPGSHTNATGAATDKSQYSINRHVQYSFTLQNKTNRVMEKAEFWTYAPVKETATQRTVNIEASYPYELIADDLGNQVLYFKFKDLPPYDTKIIRIKAHLELSDTPAANNVKDIKPYLEAEEKIQSDNPEISGFAKKFHSTKPVTTAGNIYKWVSNSLEYTGYLREDYGALYAFKNRKGDCTEFMSLFIAMARANNVPARAIGGYVVDKNSVLKPYDFHNWAEFYDEGAWNISDPQKKAFMKNSSQYIAMRIIRNCHKIT